MRARIVGGGGGAGKAGGDLRMVRAAAGWQKARPDLRALNLSIVHYHFRPGGVRRVIELTTPHLIRSLRAEAVTLIAGERPPAAWLRTFRASAAPATVRLCIDAVLGYRDERVEPAAIRAVLDRALAGGGIVWAHNLALGRNLALSRELAARCAALDLPLVAHHHDWWCDRRWPRWPVIRRCGFRTLAAVAAAIFPPMRRVAHVAINAADAGILRRHFPGRAHWLPNPIDRPAPCKRAAGRATPVWLMPCRVLRRKNIAEALLLTRWLRPEAVLAVTGTADEADEMACASTLAAAARAHGWPLRLGVAASRRGRGPEIGDLFSRAEALVFTSIQEGFGLPQLEAAAAGLPAIIRRVPLVAPDLAAFGFRFPQSYDEILIAPGLFDWDAEVRRQARAFRAWLGHLPRSLRARAGTPPLLAHPRSPKPVAFSRLTLTAQLEVLRHAPERSWALCAPLNPFLAGWRTRAARGSLAPAAWPRRADALLSARSCARHLAKIARIPDEEPADAARGMAAQDEFIRARLHPREMFPLLWSNR